jgi:hypothetical protein
MFVPGSMRARVLFVGTSIAAGSLVLVGCELVFPNVVRGSDGDSGPLADSAPANDSGAPADAGRSTCDSGEFVFCDGFENGLVNWTSELLGGGTVAVDSTHVYRGRYALHATLPSVAAMGGNVSAEVRHAQTWPTTMFTRFFVYVTPPFPHSSTDLLILHTTTPTVTGVNIFLTGVASGSSSIGLSTFGVPDAGGAGSSEEPPANGWACILLSVNGTTATLLSDRDAGNPLVTLSFPVTTSNLSLDLGLSYVSTAVADTVHDAWFDEVSLGTTPIGCP